MCGITAYVGDDMAVPRVLASLKKLEYRGYDSSGIAFFENEKLNVVKSVGTIDRLEERICPREKQSHIAIGHTRWATHGKANEANAHPHLSQNKSVCVIHNGIIENYLSFKSKLTNINFYSQTDTEVFANMLDVCLNQDFSTQNVLKNLNELTKQIKGSYAFAILLSSCKNKIYFAKQKSPLILGIGKNFSMLCSDESALCEKTEKVIYLQDGDYGFIDKSQAQIFHSGKETKRKQFAFNFSANCVSKCGCEFFMEKEIKEGTQSVLATLENLQSINTRRLEREMKNSKKIFVVGCGTALHAGEVFKSVLEKECGLDVILDYASEFRYKKPNIGKDSLCIFISQSGETADTLASASFAKKKGAKCLAITNVQTSRITKICPYVLKTQAGVEVAVASTKAFMAQLAALYYLVLLFAKIYNKKITFSLKNILNLCKNGNNDENFEQIAKIAQLIKDEKSLFFVGRGLDYFMAKEGALKLKEVSYIHCEAFAGGELKHGSLSLIDENTFVVCLLTQKELINKMHANIIEMQSRGAKVILISPFCELKDKVFMFVEIRQAKSSLMPFVVSRPLQELAFLCAKEKGLNPDMPRNLAKSVTVE